MQIKDQIKARRESLDITMKELADRVGVTEQAVRHWESGRSLPGRTKMKVVEQALSFAIDWTEGQNKASGAKTVASMIDEHDVELLLKICKLPGRAKDAVTNLVDVHLEAVERARAAEDKLSPQARGNAAPPPPPVKKSRARA